MYKTMLSGNGKGWLFLGLEVNKIDNNRRAFLWENPKLGSQDSLQRKNKQTNKKSKN